MLFRAGLMVLALVLAAADLFAATVIDPATDLLQRAQRNVLEGKQEAAIAKLRVVARSYSKSPLAPQAQLLIAELFSRNREYTAAFEEAQLVINQFPASELFSEALEIQFLVSERVAEEYRRRRLRKERSIQGLPDREVASQMFRVILANGPFSPVAPRAQYRLAVTLDEEGQTVESVQEFNRFIENYGEHPLADDAAFQAAFVHYRVARQNNQERGSQERARLGFEDFMIRYPRSEKLPEARHLLVVLQGWEGNRMVEAGRFYERTGKPEPALRSYREAMRQTPDSAEADAARQGIKRLKGFDDPPLESAPPVPRFR
jgi:outer membrane protein assembly factor BamD (BamD/ComL family)